MGNVVGQLCLPCAGLCRATAASHLAGVWPTRMQSMRHCWRQVRQCVLQHRAQGSHIMDATAPGLQVAGWVRLQRAALPAVLDLVCL
jgi:hypothetical protein